MSDQRLYGIEDFWTYPQVVKSWFGTILHKGDCEDYCLHLTRELRKKGIYPKLIYCFTEREEEHAVLDWNGYIIDILQPSIMPRQDLDYRWIISIAMDGSPWREIID